MRQVCRLDELPIGAATLLKLDARHLLLYRTPTGEVQAYLNRCPHLGIPLAWQAGQLWDPTRRYLQCSTHGACFEPHSGLCVSGPCQGDSLWAVTCSAENGVVLIDDAELP